MLTILFDGIAYGMILFVLAVGLSVTEIAKETQKAEERKKK